MADRRRCCTFKRLLFLVLLISLFYYVSVRLTSGGGFSVEFGIRDTNTQKPNLEAQPKHQQVPPSSSPTRADNEEKKKKDLIATFNPNGKIYINGGDYGVSCGARKQYFMGKHGDTEEEAILSLIEMEKNCVKS